MIQAVQSALHLSTLRGVGPKTLDNLAVIHIHTVEDLLFHLPIRYEDRTRVTPLNELRSGDRVLIEGEIQSAGIIGSKRASLVCRVASDVGSITLRFFHFNAKQKQSLSQNGLKIRCFGEVREGYMGGFEMVHPEYRQMQYADEMPLSNRLTAIYATTKGLNQPMIRKLMRQCLSLLKQNVVLPELLPTKLREDFNMPSIAQALEFVHEPPVGIDLQELLKGVHPSQQRLAFEELLAHNLSLRQIRQKTQTMGALACCGDGVLTKQFIKQLPFSLTNAQQSVFNEIVQDLKQDYPMLRLVQGDLGSGKTVVAALTILQAVEKGYQAVLMAPTELLAEQHYQNFIDWFKPLGIDVGFLVGSLNNKERHDVLQPLLEGKIQVIIGTHALFQAGVEFQKLALIVIDEQHRFGVDQRLALREKACKLGFAPHQLTMTATPIPRSLAMTAYADLDYSAIDELPPGRQPIKTVLISNEKRSDVVERVRINCQQGSQAYWVCTLIDESESLQAQAAEAVAIALQQDLFDLKVGLVHGRLKSADKEVLMQSFKLGEIDVLVATTVIEVGVDVPNASLMIIENPERLGLSQLHQLRGRVGRGTAQSHCVLLYQMPLSVTARQRLAVMRESSDGFVIAEKDLMMRGPGEVLGTRQAGLMRFKVADIIRDKELLYKVQNADKYFHNEFEESTVKQRIIDRWIVNVENYTQV